MLRSLNRPFSVVAVLVAFSFIGRAEETATVLDFETDFAINKWPTDRAGEITFSSEWKADGARSLKIDAGLMSALDAMKLKNWSGYTMLRIAVNNPTGQTVAVGFELQDQHTQFHERHQNGFGVQPGESVIELDFSGGLWRGEENKPYRGKIKTPINVNSITRVSFTNQGTGAIYLDKIEVVKVKKLETPGGFAFDFGKAGTQVMGQFTGVFHNSAYDKTKGFGLHGGLAGALGKSMSFPTPLLGDGISLPDGGFQVDIPQGGNYIGWVAFERGGFWESEHSGYSHAALKNNGAVVHEHTFAPAGAHFLFQDTEITDMAQVADKLIWPAHAISTFKFTAAQGANVFTITTKDAVSFPLRIAGLILAPDTAEGKAFLDEHEKLQRKTIATTFAAQDRGRRGEGRAAPAKDLVVEPLPTGQMVYPRDWPLNPNGAPIGEITAVSGQKVALHLGVYAKKEIPVTVSAAALKGAGDIAAPAITYGRYMPQRPYGVGAVWLEVNHYRPEVSFTVGADVTRSVILEYDIPADAKPGDYSGTVKLSGGGESVELPVKIRVLAVKLAELPIPLGVFKNSLPFPVRDVDEATWWKLQESLLKEQIHAGLNALSGGPDLEYSIGADKITGDRAVKYIKLAQQFGPIKAIVPYGGFMPNSRGIKGDFGAVAAALKTFEENNALPQTYVYSYDEPGTEAEKNNVIGVLERATKAGFKTIGYTSSHFSDPLWVKLMESTYAPAVNLHGPEDIKKIKAAGKHPWTYNNGRDRYGWGLHLWRQIQLGVEGRMDWIGVFTQGFAFHNLDGREPSMPCFLVHRDIGVLKTTSWLSGREGLLDLRIRLALEKVAPPDDPALKLWSLDGYRDDQKKWDDAALGNVRAAMLKRLDELTKK
jgi:hypothetical protein